MSVDCEAYIGYTVTLKTNLNSADFNFFNDFEDRHAEYSQWSHKHDEDGKYNREGKVLLVIDGMSGHYTRLIFVDEYMERCWVEGKRYFPLKSQSISDDAYEELNKAYQLMYGKELDKDLIEYALWFHFS